MLSLRRPPTMEGLMRDVFSVEGIEYNWTLHDSTAEATVWGCVRGTDGIVEARRTIDLRGTHNESYFMATVAEACRSIRDELIPPPTAVEPGWEADGA